ncbi:unnamed protein product [Paramecium pentaurelia]|uniref:Uncharacterized protein n=1 Tax=Paramecium pentaurelia TaxID=43138 RepID=A0A8S1WIE2_9CILI|nr:unnamed protein product [Paramecium pentaurelia]
MYQLEDLLEKPEIYENLSLFKDFIKGVHKLCDQFEDKIKMIPKQEFLDEEKSKKGVENQIKKKIKKGDIKNQMNQTIPVGEGKTQDYRPEFEDKQRNPSDQQQINTKSQQKKKQKKVKRGKVVLPQMEEEDSFGGNIVQEYQ